MRTLSTLLLITITSLSSGQDWALINPAYRYNYSDDGTDTISNQIRVMDVDTLGVDSFRYNLNTIVEYIGPITPTSSNCFTAVEYRLYHDQVYGGAMIYADGNWWIPGADTILVKNFATIGQSWDAGNGITGTIVSAMTTTVIGQQDSVKWMEFSNGRSIHLSKDHGVILHSLGEQQYGLIGVQGSINNGMRYPEMLDLFDYQAGDVLEYRGTYTGTDGLCFTQGFYTIRYEVLTRSDVGSRTEYQMRKIMGSQYSSYPLIGSGGCTGGSFSSEVIVTLGVDQEGWSEDNFLGNRWLDKSWPGAFAAVSWDDPYPGEFATYGVGPVWRVSKNSADRYIMHAGSPLTVDLTQERLPEPCPLDTGLATFNVAQYVNRYVEGIGRTFVSILDFERSGTDSLYAYSIGGEQVGTFTPVDIILSIPREERAVFTISPNPAQQNLSVTTTQGGRDLVIRDLEGRTVLNRRIASSVASIDLEQLAPGMYMVAVDAMIPQRLIIIR
jgi:hypothetical protein